MHIAISVIYLADVNIKEVYDKFYLQLVTSLPMKDAIFVAHLSKLLAGDLMHKVCPESKSTPAEAAKFFLDNVVGPAIEIGDYKPFTILLSKMEAVKSILLQNIAKEIRKEIQKLKPSTGKNTKLIYVIYSYVRTYMTMYNEAVTYVCMYLYSCFQGYT